MLINGILWLLTLFLFETICKWCQGTANVEDRRRKIRSFGKFHKFPWISTNFTSSDKLYKYLTVWQFDCLTVDPSPWKKDGDEGLKIHCFATINMFCLTDKTTVFKTFEWEILKGDILKLHQLFVCLQNFSKKVNFFYADFTPLSSPLPHLWTNPKVMKWNFQQIARKVSVNYDYAHSFHKPHIFYLHKTFTSLQIPVSLIHFIIHILTRVIIIGFKFCFVQTQMIEFIVNEFSINFLSKVFLSNFPQTIKHRLCFSSASTTLKIDRTSSVYNKSFFFFLSNHWNCRH